MSDSPGVIHPENLKDNSFGEFLLLSAAIIWVSRKCLPYLLRLKEKRESASATFVSSMWGKSRLCILEIIIQMPMKLNLIISRYGISLSVFRKEL